MVKIDPRNQFCYEDNPGSVDVWVCGDWFPVGSFSKNIAGFPINRLLKTQLDYLIKNVVNDWDFTLLICGEGEVRIGKSTLAQQISTYWTWSLMHILKITLPHSVSENIVFNGSELISRGNKLGRSHLYSSLIFDEAGADLEGIKIMKQTTQNVKDYLRECGQYNMLNILVIPEFFDLPKGIAISRSIAMINVYWLPDEDGNFERGYFKFYNKPDKKWLYLKGKRDLDYNCQKETFYGRFYKFYTYDEKEYKKSKRDALNSREKTDSKNRRMIEVFYSCLKILRDKLGIDSTRTLSEEINRTTIDVKVSSIFIHRFIHKVLKMYHLKSDGWNIIEPEEEEKDE